jgi:hypothetical protein
MDTPRVAPRPWYRRRAFLLTATVAVVVAVAVVTDFPTRASQAQKIADAKSFVTQEYQYLQSCNAAMTETFSLAKAVASGRLSPQDRAEVPSLLSDDHLACSYTNNDVFELASLDIPRSLPDSNELASALLKWIVPDAYGATAAVIALVARPGDPTASTQLREWESSMSHDRADALRALAVMDSELHTKLPALPLVAVPPGRPPLTSG